MKELGAMNHEELETLRLHVSQEIRNRRRPSIVECTTCGKHMTRVGFDAKRLMAIELRLEGKTFQEVGQEMGLSSARAGQLFNTGIGILRRAVRPVKTE